MSETVLVEAPAKVNLHLGVGRLRDDGFHAVETVLQTIDLADSVRLRHADVFKVTCHPDLEIPAKQNLVWKATMLMARRIGCEPRVEVELTKAIPMGAGLGGGSSDAAAVIVGLARLWGLDEGDDPILAEVAVGISMDVPFFLQGGTALFGGRGDEFLRQIAGPKFDVVVVKPPQPVRTQSAYVEFDYAPVPAGTPSALLAACEACDTEGVARSLSNNMERAAVTLVPEVADALAWVRGTAGVLGGAVAGSGSAVFGICSDRQVAEDAASEARLFGWWSVAARTRDNGVQARVAEEAS